jgi:hypothetical protein
MAFNCHQDDLHSVFTCKSSFTKYVPPIEKLSIQDNVPEIEKIERKKNNNVHYLPGERLLINLEKEKQKHKKKKDPDRTGLRDPLDIAKVQKSLSRVLTSF